MYVIDLAAPFSAHEGFILMHRGIMFRTIYPAYLVYPECVVNVFVCVR
jgi:hypothetical protein